MKYRFIALIGLLALSAGAVMQAQDYDDIYYDASKSASGTTQAVKATKQSKTIAVYNEIPEKYKVAANENYRVERDEDEYNRRGAYDPTYEIDINGDTIFGDTIYEESFANTRRIERFYNPDIVILSDDDDLVELYYDESPSINLIVGTDVGLMASYGWSNSFYPWYTDWYPYYSPYYSPWYAGWHDPWSPYWYSPWSYRWRGPSLWGWHYWGYRPWTVGWGYHYGWDNWAWHGGYTRPGYRPDGRHGMDNWRGRNTHVGLSSNRNRNTGINRGGTTRTGIASRPTTPSRSSGSTVRGGYTTSRGGNIGNTRTTSRGIDNVGNTRTTSRGVGSSSISRSSSTTPRSTSSYGGSYGSSRGSSGSYSGGGSYGGGSRGGSSGGSSGGSGRRH